MSGGTGQANARDKMGGEVMGDGIGADGSIKPAAIIIINKESVRIESTKGGF